MHPFVADIRHTNPQEKQKKKKKQSIRQRNCCEPIRSTERGGSSLFHTSIVKSVLNMVDMEVVNNCQNDLELIINRWILDFYYSRGIEFFLNDKKEDFLSVKNIFESKHVSDGFQNFLLLVRAFAGIFVLILFELQSHLLIALSC